VSERTADHISREPSMENLSDTSEPQIQPNEQKDH